MAEASSTVERSKVGIIPRQNAVAGRPYPRNEVETIGQ